MITKSIQVRMDPKLKGRVEEVLNGIGMDVPTAVRVFFAKIVATGGIPFTLGTDDEDHYTPKQLAAIDRLARDAERGIGLSRSFSSAEELIADLRK